MLLPGALQGHSWNHSKTQNQIAEVEVTVLKSTLKNYKNVFFFWSKIRSIYKLPNTRVKPFPTCLEWHFKTSWVILTCFWASLMSVAPPADDAALIFRSPVPSRSRRLAEWCRTLVETWRRRSWASPSTTPNIQRFTWDYWSNRLGLIQL
jgi:thiosulfate reductase cytochrome b subunit